MLIDVHGHLWAGDVAKSRRDVLALCARYGIHRAFISTLDEASLVPDAAEIRRMNDLTLAFMHDAPALIEGMAYLNPRNEDSAIEATRCLDAGMRGIKLWVATLCDDPLVDPIARLAIARDVPVLVHAFYKATGRLPYESLAWHVGNLARRHPRLRVLMAHVGANVYDAVRCIKDCPNVLVDFSGSIFRGDDLDYTVALLGADRVLFGSDMPGSFESCFGQVFGASLSSADRESILWRNAVDCFRLKGVKA